MKAAEPIIQAAEAALNSLDKKSLGELKSFGSPAAEVVEVASACMVLRRPGREDPQGSLLERREEVRWARWTSSSTTSSTSTRTTPRRTASRRCEKDYLSNPNFNPEYIVGKSGAAAGLCAWVVNICKYFRIYQVVAPKRKLLAEANAKLDAANKKLARHSRQGEGAPGRGGGAGR